MMLLNQFYNISQASYFYETFLFIKINSQFTYPYIYHIISHTWLLVLTWTRSTSLARSAGVVAATMVTSLRSSAVFLRLSWNRTSWGWLAHCRAASTIRAVASAKVFAAASRRRWMSESGCFSASPCKAMVRCNFIRGLLSASVKDAMGSVWSSRLVW